MGPSGVKGREGLLTEDVRDPKSRLCTRRNLQDNTQGHTKESNTIWKYKTHNPSADRGDTSLSDVLIFCGSCLYLKFWHFRCVLTQMFVSWCNLSWPSAEQLYKMSLLIEWMRRRLTIFEAWPFLVVLHDGIDYRCTHYIMKHTIYFPLLASILYHFKAKME